MKPYDPETFAASAVRNFLLWIGALAMMLLGGHPDLQIIGIFVYYAWLGFHFTIFLLGIRRKSMQNLFFVLIMLGLLLSVSFTIRAGALVMFMGLTLGTLLSLSGRWDKYFRLFM